MHPKLVKHVILPLHERAIGRPTLAMLHSLLRTQFLSYDELIQLQIRKLRTLAEHAVAACPAYAIRFREAGIDPRELDLDSLRQLPLLTKDDLRADISSFCAPSVPGGLHRYTTGGSSGDPLTFFVDRRRQAADQAARARSRSWFGIDIGQREFFLWGAAVEQCRQDRLKTLRDRITNHRLVSAFQMTPERMDDYLSALEQFDPVHIFAYPTSLAQLADYAASSGRKLNLPALRAIFVTGEVLTPADRRTITNFFSVPVADGYGAREAGFIAHECLHGAMHISMESLLVELLDAQNLPVAEGRLGEVVVTHLDAYGMPFIRYGTGDMARWNAKPCPCGRNLRALAAVEGRRGDAIRTPDGGFAHSLSAIYPLRESPLVRQFQVTQRADFSLDIALVPVSNLAAADLSTLRSAMSRQFQDRLPIRLRTVSSIPLDGAGKHRPVRSEVVTITAH